MPLMIARNTYPGDPRAAHGEEGDIVSWDKSPGRFDLIRDSDKKTVFSVSGLDGEGNKYSTKKPPALHGIVAQVKKHGWILELKEV